MNVRSLLPILILTALVPAIVRADPADSFGPGTLPELTDGKAPKTEKVTYLGVTAKPVDAALRAQLNLPQDTGLTVMTVDHKGPAGADLQVNDVLQKLDDQILIDSHQLVTLIRLHKPGDSVKLGIIREAKPMQVTIKLGEKERVVPAGNDADHIGELNGTPPPDDQSPAPPFDPTQPLGPNNQVALSFSDDTYSAMVKPDTQGRRHMIVKDQTGQVVASGPVDTEEEWNKFDPDIRKHLEVMHKMLARKGK